MRKPEKIVLTKENKDAMTLAIKNYFYTERDEDLGDLAAALILDFFIEKLAPEFYNQGIYDSNKYMYDKAEDLLTLII